jgi:hypothetical protein
MEYSNIYLPADSAEWVVRNAIQAHGGGWNGKHVGFRFRDRQYYFIVDSGRYEYVSIYSENDRDVMDILNNDGFKRKENGRDTILPAMLATNKAASLNAVVYFFMLPQRLLDPAVVLKYLGKVAIDTDTYFLVDVGFEPAGGGEDHDDEFMFWFGEKDFYMDFFAYRYHRDGGGVRFRVVDTAVAQGGFRIQQYINYKTDSLNVSLQSLPTLYANGELIELSRITVDDLEMR